MRLLLLLLLASAAHAQRVTIDRVDAMPALPPDFKLVDWDARARAFDALAFDTSRSGDGLPLVFTFAGQNAPQGFGLTTFAGDRRGQTAEAISALPALVSAALVGRPRSDWTDEAAEYFVAGRGEGVYLNTPGGTSGGDWWYDTMPNVFFYQLYDLYGPGEGRAAQFVSVANRWLAALDTLGGSVRPWDAPFLGYRGFRLAEMEPNRSGVIEPEAAGALAWLMWAAYYETEDDRYRVGAEWALAFLDEWETNPSYELQLPYGALAAARANAELGARYDVEKLVRWTFEIGPLRRWGAFTASDWGGYSPAGLIGSADDFGGYAFALNGFQQAAALVPLVRYDDRFARTVGRWMTNLASASRLFYPDQLPDSLQTNADWARTNGAAQALPYEALRRRGPTGETLFASGDAIRLGWATTNLSTYSGASAGYLAAVVDTTDVPGILRLDLNATDFFAPPSYASHLYYNPHSDARLVTLRLPFGRYDLYDAASDAFVLTGQTGSAEIPLEPDAARVIVVVPSGAATTAERGVLRVGDVAIDYRYGLPSDLPPRVRALAASSDRLGVGEAATLWCTPYDPDADATVTTWSATGGTLVPSGERATFSAPSSGTYRVACTVTAGSQSAERTLALTVLDNRPPDGVQALSSADGAEPGGQVALTCSARDPDGDALVYTWTADGGSVADEADQSSGGEAVWTLPQSPGLYSAVCTAQDPDGGAATDTVRVTSGTLVFRSDGASDASPFGHPVALIGGAQTAHVDGRIAFVLDGQDDAAQVLAGVALSPSRAVTVAAYVRPGAFERERFVVSHGSWQQRYKLSLTPDGVPRWSVRTAAGVVDLDAPSAVPLGSWTHLAASFDGATMRLYVDFVPIAETPLAGVLPPVDVPLLIGQMLPGQTDYNFDGALADVAVFNVALTADELAERIVTSVRPPTRASSKLRAYPSPARGRVTIEPGVPEGQVSVYDALGRRVARLGSGPLPSVLQWEAALAPGVYTVLVTTPSQILRQTVVLL
jgi:hypothetical protein